MSHTGESNDSEIEDDMDCENFSDTEETVSILECKTTNFDSEIVRFDYSKSGSNCKDVGPLRNEIDFFKLFFDDTLMTFVVNETNGHYQFVKKNCPKQNSRLARWTEVNISELYVFFGVCMLMSCNSRNKIEDYWSTDKLLHSPIFSESMARNRFQLILRMLNFCDNSEQQTGDGLQNIKKLINHFKKIFSQYMYPSMNLHIENYLLCFEGKSMFPQYISSKADPFGIELFILNDRATGYILDFIMYTGKSTDYIITSQLGMAGSIVMTLMEPYLDKGHILYINDEYTSRNLFLTLHNRSTYICGEVGRKKKGITTFKKVSDQEDEKEKPTITTIKKLEVVNTDKTAYHKKNIIESNIVHEYNKHLSDVDNCDPLLLSDTSDTTGKTMRWYIKIFFYFMDLSSTNAHILYCEKTGKNVPLDKFRLELIRQLIHERHKYSDSDTSSRTPKKLDLEITKTLPLTERHFPEKLPPTQKRISVSARCKVCLKNKVRRESRYRCKQCKVTLCIEPCFEKYHTEENIDS